MTETVEQRLHHQLAEKNERVGVWQRFIQEQQEEADFWLRKATEGTDPEQVKCFNNCSAHARSEVERGQRELGGLQGEIQSLQTAFNHATQDKQDGNQPSEDSNQ